MSNRKNLKIFRVEQGLTQAQMAARLEISESHYKSIERGANDPSYKVIQKFGEAFEMKGLDIWNLFKTD